MKITLVLFGFFFASVQCNVTKPEALEGRTPIAGADAEVLDEGTAEYTEEKAGGGNSEAPPTPKPEPTPGKIQDCKPTDACSGNGGYCIANTNKNDCDGLLFPNECRSAQCSCCVQVKVNECAAGTDTCPANSECHDKEAGYECACNVGFEQCGDINECDSNPCGPNMRCQNTYGSYECICNSGFEKVNGACVDINECTNTTNPCGPNSVCSNSPPGSFSCSCNAGFVLCDGTCVDKNECDSNPCPANTICQNTDGSYQCICPTGFTNQTGSCVDVNECSSSPSPCTDLERCINTPGNYSCVCQKCSPRCDRGGVLLPNNVCVSVIYLPSSPMTWDEASMRCGTLYKPSPFSYVNVVGNLFFSNTNESAWVEGIKAIGTNFRNCPAISNDGAYFMSVMEPCDTRYPYAICSVPRLW
ncbi:adhesion G protein-coupled receptor E2-like isoform X2 [Macrobrachium nipponense]|uniref:adhesion G protein-coupled receptor E2-like isoform X2 n=1 Tax=Macrobrachium nipponense TaxID=159736 RepID=UPI0030C86612